MTALERLVEARERVHDVRRAGEAAEACLRAAEGLYALDVPATRALRRTYAVAALGRMRRALEAAEAALAQPACEVCGDRGWLHAYADGDEHEDREIQRCQTCEALPSDAVAAQRHRIECACGWREVSRRYEQDGGTMQPVPTFGEVTP